MAPEADGGAEAAWATTRAVFFSIPLVLAWVRCAYVTLTPHSTSTSAAEVTLPSSLLLTSQGMRSGLSLYFSYPFHSHRMM
jgi:hypothetical protein